MVVKALYPLFSSLALLATFLTSCLDETVILQDEKPSSLSVQAKVETPISKGVIYGSSFPSNSDMTVFVTDMSGNSYNPELPITSTYYVAAGNGEAQEWLTKHDIPLYDKQGLVYAYYPKSHVPREIQKVEGGDIDYMYADPVQVNKTNPQANLNFHHALCAIQMNCTKNSAFKGNGICSAFKVSGQQVPRVADLHNKTGQLSNFKGYNDEIVSYKSDCFLGDGITMGDIIVIPNGISGAIQLSVKVDSVWYSVTSDPIALRQGYKYIFDISVGVGYIALDTIRPEPWIPTDVGSQTIKMDKKTIHLEGNRENIAINCSFSGSTCFMYALGIGGAPRVPEVTGAYFSTSVKENKRTIILSEMERDVYVKFNGLLSELLWPENGVYVVKADGSILDSKYASSDCIGVALSNAETGQKFMVEKYENLNNEESSNLYERIALSCGGTITSAFSFGGFETDLGTTPMKEVGGGSTGVSGYLLPDGSSLSFDPSMWTSGALSDFNGKQNSQYLVTVLDNGNSSKTNAPVGLLLNAFNSAVCPLSVNQGYFDWYLPSCGQLGLIRVNIDRINYALEAISGTPFGSLCYYSSTESNASYAWFVCTSDGEIGICLKDLTNCVRLIRDL